jgi:hypothetical protein
MFETFLVVLLIYVCGVGYVAYKRKGEEGALKKALSWPARMF